jgi:hypothetical protein
MICILESDDDAICIGMLNFLNHDVMESEHVEMHNWVAH